MARALESMERLREIRSGQFNGAGRFTCTYTGGGIPNGRSQESLLAEASQNCFAPVKFKEGKLYMTNPFLSDKKTPKDSTVVTTPNLLEEDLYAT